MKRFVVVAMLLLAVGVASARKGNGGFPFDPDRAMLVSHPDNKMTHCASTVIRKNGDVFVSQIRDQKNNHEDPKNNTIEVAISKFNLRNQKSEKVAHTTVVRAGGQVGNFKQAEGVPPYDTFLFDAGDKIRCLFFGYGDCWQLMVVDMDPKSCKFDNDVKQTTLTYTANGSKTTVPITAEGFRKFYEDIGVTNFNKYERPIPDKKFTQIGEWYYSVIGNWCCRGSIPTVVRTKDAINFEVVFTCPEYVWGAAETAMAIHNDRCYIIARTARPSEKPRRGVYMGCYSLKTGECLRKPYKIGSVESRPDMLCYKGKVYAMYNTDPSYINEKGKKVYRSRVRIAELLEDASVLRAWEISSPRSIQYYCMNEHKGKAYLTFGEDRFLRAKSYKGSIAFTKLNLE